MWMLVIIRRKKFDHPYPHMGLPKIGLYIFSEHGFLNLRLLNTLNRIYYH